MPMEYKKTQSNTTVGFPEQSFAKGEIKVVGVDESGGCVGDIGNDEDEIEGGEEQVLVAVKRAEPEKQILLVKKKGDPTGKILYSSIQPT